ncbi:MAG: hypothetical protein IJK18_02230 [Clostridia bacterium]|nr:hypothetical protein [Clostridia bacterium]
MMTNEQRDELLISIAKGLNNLQGAFNDFRVEIKAELNTKVDALDKKFTSKIDALDQKFTAKIDALDQKFTAKIDALDQRVGNLEKDNVQIKSDLSNLEKDNAQIKSDIKELAKNQAEFREETKVNIEAASEIIRDIYKTNYETTQHLKRHDIEIQELQSKLA